MAPFKGHLSDSIAATREIKFRVSVLMDYCGGTNTPSTCLGNAPGLNYAFDYRTSSGIVVPHRRRVFVYDSEKCKVAEPLLVAIDTHEIEFS